MTLAGVKKRLTMPNRRLMDEVVAAAGHAESCALCGGMFRATEPAQGRFGICPGCKSEAVVLSGRVDPRATA